MVRKSRFNNGNGEGLENLNFDDPTSEETERHQRTAEDIELSRLHNVYLAKRFLREAEHADTHNQRIVLLRDVVGYKGVYVNRKSRTVPFNKAPKGNVFRMFNKELEYQRSILDRFDKSLYGKRILSNN